MKVFLNHRGRKLVAVAAATVGVAAFAGTTLPSTAHADPAWGPASSPLVAVGSNAIEDLLDAYSGVAPTPGALADADCTAAAGQAPCAYHYFSPLADPVSGEQVYSWDAALQSQNQNGTIASGDCISATPGAAPIARPNGAGDGNLALSAAIAGVGWSKTTSSGNCAVQSPTGEIEISRDTASPTGSKSSGGLGDGTCGGDTLGTASECIAWVDIAHDAVTYAYYINPGSGVSASSVDALTNANLTAIYSSTATNGLTTLSSVTYMPCLPQLGSGLEKDFVGALNSGSGISTTTAETAAKAAKCYNFEQNGASTFESYAATAFAVTANAGAEVAITPFFVGSWIGQLNGYAFNRSAAGIAAGVGLGTIDGGSLTEVGGSTTTCASPPYTETSTSPVFYTPDSCYENAALYSNEDYLGVSNSKLNDAISSVQSAVYQRIFGYAGNGFDSTGPTANSTTGTGAVCTAAFQDELADFGLVPAENGPVTGNPDCGQEVITSIAAANSGTNYLGS